MDKLKICFILIIALLIYGCSDTNTSTEDISPGNSNIYIENKGSDTIVNLALAWAEEYQSLHPEIRISVTGGGSGTGIAALINGTVDIANASRKIKEEEFQNAVDNGIVPVEHIIAKDAIAVIVNQSNPIEKLTLQQISDIYSGKIKNWSEIEGYDHPIVLLSRETNSGTHVYFLEQVLRLGDKNNKTLFSRETLLLPSSEGISSEIRLNPNAIGYDGLGYVTPDLKVIAISNNEDGGYIYPTEESVLNNTYPIARDLYMYTNGDPSGAIKDYIDWLFTPEAQKIVSELGFVPMTNQR
jgi:phosphate transport system substrate-binding protein